MTENDLPFFFVSWHDAVVDSGGWSNSTEEHSLHTCYSCGWLIRENRKEIVLAGDISDPQEGVEGCDVNRRIAIPKAWIITRKKVKLPK